MINPFITTLDLLYEEKCFKAFCRGKSKKYTYYSEWETYTKERINSTLATKEQLYNFKHYCKIKRDTIKSYSSMSKDIYIVFFSVSFTLVFSYLRSLFDFTASTLIEIIEKIIALAVLFLILLFLICQPMSENYTNSTKVCFYNDLLEIIASCENERNANNSELSN